MRLVLAAVVVPVFGYIVPALRNLIRGWGFAIRLRCGPCSAGIGIGLSFSVKSSQVKFIYIAHLQTAKPHQSASHKEQLVQ